MTILLLPGITIKGFGFVHDDHKLYVISTCCGWKIDYRSEPNGTMYYYCGKCEAKFPQAAIDPSRNWLPVVYLTKFTAQDKKQDPGNMQKWIYAWTGQTDIDIEVKH